MAKKARWTIKEIRLLKKSYNSSYADLQKMLNRSTRAIKHKIHSLGLSRLERRKISQYEKDIILNNRNKKRISLPGRSSLSVERMRRKLLGTARSLFKAGWDVQSTDLAYFLGAVCSDMGVYKYNVVIIQKFSNNEMVLEVQRIFSDIFGFKPYIREQAVGGVKYKQVGVCSTQFLKNFGDDAAWQRGNLRQSDGEWIDFILNKFKWVFQGDYFWYFIGGLYDGDGSLVRRSDGWFKISLAVKPRRSREYILEELHKRGYNFVPNSYDQCDNVYDVVLKGGQQEVDRFLGDVQCKISRKKNK